MSNPNPNVSPIGVTSFPNLYTPKPPAPGADPRYSVILIFDELAQQSAEYKRMKQEVLKAAEEKWGNKAGDMIKNGQVRLPFRDASEKDFAGFDDGKTFCTFWTKSAQPQVVDGNRQPVLESDTFPGMKARVTYNAFAYENSGNKGVSLGLGNLQVADFSTPRLDGRRSGEDDFDSIDTPGAAGTDDGMDDIPF